MSKQLMLGAMVCVVALVASVSQATLKGYEPFNYAPGSYSEFTQNGGTNWTGAWEQPINIASPGLAHDNLVVGGNKMTPGAGNIDANRRFADQSSGALWFSFVSNTPSGTGIRVGALNGGWGGIYFGKETWTSDYRSGNNPTGISGQGVQSLIVVRMDLTTGNDSARMWVFPQGASIPDPNLAQLPNDAQGTYTGGTNDLGSIFFFRVQVSQGASIDEMRVGTTYGDVVALTPEPATMALMGMGAVALIRRRK